MTNDNVFNHFKIHTQYSICEGAIKIDDLQMIVKIVKSQVLEFATALIFVEL